MAEVRSLRASASRKPMPAIARSSSLTRSSAGYFAGRQRGPAILQGVSRLIVQNSHQGLDIRNILSCNLVVPPARAQHQQYPSCLLRTASYRYILARRQIGRIPALVAWPLCSLKFSHYDLCCSGALPRSKAPLFTLGSMPVKWRRSREQVRAFRTSISFRCSSTSACIKGRDQICVNPNIVQCSNARSIRGRNFRDAKARMSSSDGVKRE